MTTTSIRRLRSALVLALATLPATTTLASPLMTKTIGGKVPISIGGGGTIITPPALGALCLNASLAVCQKLETYDVACQASLKTDCQALFQDRIQTDIDQAQAITGTSYATIQPSGMKHAGTLLPAAYVPYDSAAITGGVSSDFSYGTVIHTTVLDALASDTLLTLGRTARLDSFHPTWELSSPGDGAQTNSCDEYVWKKYYDYERFREAAATCKSDDECLYQLAVLPVTPGLGMSQLRSGDAARTASAVQVRPFIQGPLSGAVTHAEDRPKNEFFTVPPYVFAARVKWLSDDATGSGVGGVHADPYSIGDRFQWHEDMHAKHQPYALTHAEYEDMERRRRAIVPAMARFLDAKQTLMSAPGGAATYLQIMNPGMVKCPPKPAPSPGGGVPMPGGGSIDLPGLPLPVCKPSTAPTSYPVDSAAGQLVLAANEIAQLLIAEWNHKSPRDGSVDHGCLDTGSTRCDWSPKMMREYLHLFQVEKERDFQKCVQQTGNYFPTAYPPVYPADSSDWDHLETYLATAKDELEKQTKDLPWRGDGTLGDQVSITKSLGDPKWFGVTFDGGVDWNATFSQANFNGATRICGAQGKAGGHLKATAHVLTSSFNVIDGEVSVHAGQGGDPTGYTNAHLRILESWIIGADPNVFSPVVEQAAAFHIATDPKTWTLADVSTTVYVPFPVTVGAGADLALGWTLDGSGTAPQGCGSDHPAFQMSGTFTPSAGVHARAWGAIGASYGPLGAEAGIEGDLTLVQASLPVNVTIALSDQLLPSGLPGQLYPSLTLDTSTNLDLTLLSGEVKAYAELCVVKCFRKEMHLFGWDGVHYRADVFPPLHKSWALQAVQAAHKGAPIVAPTLLSKRREEKRRHHDHELPPFCPRSRPRDAGSAGRRRHVFGAVHARLGPVFPGRRGRNRSAHPPCALAPRAGVSFRICLGRRDQRRRRVGWWRRRWRLSPLRAAGHPVARRGRGRHAALDVHRLARAAFALGDGQRARPDRRCCPDAARRTRGVAARRQRR